MITVASPARAHRMLVIGLVPLLLGACTSEPLPLLGPGRSTIRDGIYVNHTHALTLAFENPRNWAFGGMRAENPAFLFDAVNLSRVLFLGLVVEDAGLEMENRDYQIAAKLNLDEEIRARIEDLSLEDVDLNGNQALVWKYLAAFEEEGTSRNVHFTVAYFQRGTQNAALSIWTPVEFYERRQQEIDGIVRSFDW